MIPDKKLLRMLSLLGQFGFTLIFPSVVLVLLTRWLALPPWATAVALIVGLLAGISGLIYSSRIMSNDSNNAGLNYEMDAILAVVIGGTSMSGGKFSLAGTIIGSIIIRTIVTFVYYFGIVSEATMFFKACIIAVVIVLQSEPMREYFAKRAKRRNAAKAMAKGGVQNV